MWDIISAKEPQASNKAKSLCNTVLWILRYPDYQNYVYSMLFGILSALSVWKIIFFQVKPKQKRPGSWWPLSLWHSVNKYSVKKCAVDLLYFDIFNLKGHTLITQEEWFLVNHLVINITPLRQLLCCWFVHYVHFHVLYS